MKFDPRHAGWILHSTVVNKDGSLISQTCFQLTSSLDMLELFKERKAWSEGCGFQVHFHLMRVNTYAPSSSFVICSYPSEEELEFYAKEEQNLIDSNKP